jgi:hypothetical protein
MSKLIIAVHSKARSRLPFTEDIGDCVSIRPNDGQLIDEDGQFELIPYRCDGCLHLHKISNGTFLIYIIEEYLHKINSIKAKYGVDNITIIFSDTVPKGHVVVNDGTHKPANVAGIPTHYVV